MAALELRACGWGMVPEHELARRVGGPELIDLLPQATVDVALYWQHWLREPPSAQALTQAVRQAASQQLAPLPPAAGGDSSMGRSRLQASERQYPVGQLARLGLADRHPRAGAGHLHRAPVLAVRQQR